MWQGCPTSRTSWPLHRSFARASRVQGHQGNGGQTREWIAISGVGGLGQLAIQYAKAMGLHVAALDVTEGKLDLARASGAEVTMNARLPDAAAQIVRQTGGGAHGALVTAVSPAAFRQAIY